jgi:hypothetical protein
MDKLSRMAAPRNRFQTSREQARFDGEGWEEMKMAVGDCYGLARELSIDMMQRLMNLGLSVIIMMVPRRETKAPKSPACGPYQMLGGRLKLLRH